MSERAETSGAQIRKLRTREEIEKELMERVISLAADEVMIALNTGNGCQNHLLIRDALVALRNFREGKKP